MEWLGVVGNLISFIGSIIISVDLLKSKEHAAAQNKIYWGSNPFSLRSVKSNIIGFLLLVTGFSLTLGKDLVGILKLDSPSSLFLIIGITSLGYLIIFVLYRFNECSYRKIESNRRLLVFNSSIKNTRDKFYNIIGQHNEKQLFDTYINTDLNAIRTNFKDVDEDKRTDSMSLLINQLETAKNANNIVDAIKKYQNN